MPGEAIPATTILDRIAEDGDPGSDFGGLAHAVLDGVVYLCYLDRAADGDAALKLLRRRSGVDDWDLDLAEGVGRPLAVLRGRGGVHLLAEVDGALADIPLWSDTRDPARTLLGGVRAAGPISAVRSPEGDVAVVFESASGRVVVAGWSHDGPVLEVVAPPAGGAFGPVLHARSGLGGAVDLFYFDPSTNELLDLLDLQRGRTLIRVTPSRGATAVWAHTGPGGTLYLYADHAPGAQGALTPTLTLTRSPRAEARARPVAVRLATSAVAFRALQGYAEDGMLYVLALSDVLALYRIPDTPG
jgi:hypothetical protein